MRIVKAELVHGVAFLTAEDAEGFRNTKKVVATARGFYFSLGRALAHQAADTPDLIVVDAPYCSCWPCHHAQHTERLPPEPRE